MAFKKGNKVGKVFSAENQPTREAKSLGQQKSKHIKTAIEETFCREIDAFDFISEEQKAVFKKAGRSSKMTVIDVIVISAVEKAIQGDAVARAFLVDRVWGKPTLPISSNHNHNHNLRYKTNDELEKMLRALEANADNPDFDPTDEA